MTTVTIALTITDVLLETERLMAADGNVDYANAKARAIAECVIGEFDSKAPELYAPEAREAGYIETPSRRGEPERYPIMAVSIGGVDTSRRTTTSYLQLTQIAAEVKAYAKAVEGSQFVMDRRRD